MSVTSIDKDFDALTLTLIADFDATAERVWQLWADPRLLERWWGPPSHPATMVDHDLTSGGEVFYYMTSPEGEKYHGRWRFAEVNPPKSLEFIDTFADADGKPAEGMPTSTIRMQLSTYDGGTSSLHSARRSAITLATCMPSWSHSPGSMQTTAQAIAFRVISA